MVHPWNGSNGSPIVISFVQQMLATNKEEKWKGISDKKSYLMWVLSVAKSLLWKYQLEELDNQLRTILPVPQQKELSLIRGQAEETETLLGEEKAALGAAWQHFGMDSGSVAGAGPRAVLEPLRVWPGAVQGPGLGHSHLSVNSQASLEQKSGVNQVEAFPICRWWLMKAIRRPALKFFPSDKTPSVISFLISIHFTPSFI